MLYYVFTFNSIPFLFTNSEKFCTFRSERRLDFFKICISFRFPFYVKSNLFSDLKVQNFSVDYLGNWILFEENWSKNVCKFTYLLIKTNALVWPNPFFMLHEKCFSKDRHWKNWFILQTKMVHNCSNLMHSEVAAKISDSCEYYFDDDSKVCYFFSSFISHYDQNFLI